MSRRWREATGSFVVRNAFGDEFRIIEYTTYIENRTMHGVTITPARLKELRGEDGRHVNCIASGQFSFVDEPEEVLTVDVPVA